MSLLKHRTQQSISSRPQEQCRGTLRAIRHLKVIPAPAGDQPSCLTGYYRRFRLKIPGGATHERGQHELAPHPGGGGEARGRPGPPVHQRPAPPPPSPPRPPPPHLTHPPASAPP